MFTFPTIRFVTNPLWIQWLHLFTEVIELGIALFVERDMEHAARESWDVRCSDETLQRIMMEKGIDIRKGLEEVRQGHFDRGYYLGPQ
jgi:hypothetical protein